MGMTHAEFIITTVLAFLLVVPVAIITAVWIGFVIIGVAMQTAWYTVAGWPESPRTCRSAVYWHDLSPKSDRALNAKMRRR